MNRPFYVGLDDHGSNTLCSCSSRDRRPSNSSTSIVTDAISTTNALSTTNATSAAALEQHHLTTTAAYSASAWSIAYFFLLVVIVLFLAGVPPYFISTNGCILYMAMVLPMLAIGFTGLHVYMVDYPMGQSTQSLITAIDAAQKHLDHVQQAVRSSTSGGQARGGSGGTGVAQTHSSTFKDRLQAATAGKGAAGLFYEAPPNCEGNDATPTYCPHDEAAWVMQQMQRLSGHASLQANSPALCFQLRAYRELLFVLMQLQHTILAGQSPDASAAVQYNRGLAYREDEDSSAFRPLMPLTEHRVHSWNVATPPSHDVNARRPVPTPLNRVVSGEAPDEDAWGDCADLLLSHSQPTHSKHQLQPASTEAATAAAAPAPPPTISLASSGIGSPMPYRYANPDCPLYITYPDGEAVQLPTGSCSSSVLRPRPTTDDSRQRLSPDGSRGVEDATLYSVTGVMSPSTQHLSPNLTGFGSWRSPIPTEDALLLPCAAQATTPLLDAGILSSLTNEADALEDGERHGGDGDGGGGGRDRSSSVGVAAPKMSASPPTPPAPRPGWKSVVLRRSLRFPTDSPCTFFVVEVCSSSEAGRVDGIRDDARRYGFEATLRRWKQCPGGQPHTVFGLERQRGGCPFLSFCLEPSSTSRRGLTIMEKLLYNFDVVGSIAPEDSVDLRDKLDDTPPTTGLTSPPTSVLTAVPASFDAPPVERYIHSRQNSSLRAHDASSSSGSGMSPRKRPKVASSVCLTWRTIAPDVRSMRLVLLEVKKTRGGGGQLASPHHLSSASSEGSLTNEHSTSYHEASSTRPHLMPVLVAPLMGVDCILERAVVELREEGGSEVSVDRNGRLSGIRRVELFGVPLHGGAERTLRREVVLGSTST